MKTHSFMIRVALIVAFLTLGGTEVAAQAIGSASAVMPQSPAGLWSVSVNFTSVPKKRVKQFYLLTINGSTVQQIDLTNTRFDPTGFIYTGDAPIPLLSMVDANGGSFKFVKPYEARLTVENDVDGKDDVYLKAQVLLVNAGVALDAVQKLEAKSVDSSDIYIAGEVNGAHKRKTDYTAEIKLQKYIYFNPNRRTWRHAPFFKLNASTDPDADPDKMELGWGVQLLTDIGPFDNKIKLESERDFENTNLIYDTRFTFLPRLQKGRGQTKIFLNPFIGGEFGKNIRSPLKAAEGDGIARILAGADLRLSFYLKEDSEEPEINWTTTYQRRWLLTDELQFEADKDGKLKLISFGKSPRDYVNSKVSYNLSKFFGVFTEYEWGQVPPSYKLVDHRFRLGFEYKFKFGVK